MSLSLKADPTENEGVVGGEGWESGGGGQGMGPAGQE